MPGEQRSVITARVLGGVHRDKPKLKMFMVSVVWSDQAEIIIYRSFKDFRKFHNELKKRFPHLNPFRKDNRMLPKFSGKARRSSLKQKGSRRSVRQMKFLESYCDKLLRSDQSVTRSSEVTQFFTPKDHDLQPDFTKNTVMIMMSEDSQPGAGRPGGNVTHPFVTQTYRCVAPYETKDTKNRAFQVEVDEKLDVLIKDPAGWWLVENEAKRLAWFPAPYLEVLDGEEEEEEDGALAGSLYCAVRSYSSKKSDEVSVSIGSVVEVLRKSDDGWWLIRFNGRVGYIPSMYLQPHSNPRAALLGLQGMMHRSTLNLSTAGVPKTSPRAGGGSGLDSGVPARVRRAQSLDVLTESWLQEEAVASPPDGLTRSDSSDSSNSAESVLSGFSSSSDSSASPSSTGRLSDRRSSDTSSTSSSTSSSDSSSASSKNSDVSSPFSSSSSSSSGPRVPPRPKTEEILTRCTTMTRKAALATKTRLQIQPDAVHAR